MIHLVRLLKWSQFGLTCYHSSIHNWPGAILGAITVLIWLTVEYRTGMRDRDGGDIKGDGHHDDSRAINRAILDRAD